MNETTFVCSVCNQEKSIQKTGGIGYGYNHSNDKICYACCGELDKKEMVEKGKTTLYLTDKAITNWPNSLSFPISYRKTGRHNFAGKRYDVWFTGPDKKNWHGVTFGDNTQICHCKRVNS